ncbi:glycosyltransferase [Marinimicrobium sp. ABcell2]|uniref:glycosyltransferase n=1 Tax=Marinimicrobium sp. ABcell2 TaxID=3069751 RepID=UPI0027AFDE2A|nr:glycosyltransferase [Marinimicrobium sp. ABcell2]MDQ2078321.1 glycosyltransferase [Marinimicrobium sp. ABcell2]
MKFAGERQVNWLKLGNAALKRSDYTSAASCYENARAQMPELSKYIQFNLDYLLPKRRELHGGLKSEQSRELQVPDMGLRIVVYTCNFGGYESVKEPLSVDPDVSYILFTDNPNLESNVWNIKYIDTKGMSPSRASRLPKILAHAYLPPHDVSVYLDSSLTLKSSNVSRDILTHLKGSNIALYQHFSRNCTYLEIEECISLGKVSKASARVYAKEIKGQGFPKKFGLLENAFIVRENTQATRFLNELWFDLYCNGEPRDQFYLMYALWRTETPYSKIENATNFRESPHLSFTSHRARDAEFRKEDGFRLKDFVPNRSFLRERVARDSHQLQSIFDRVDGSLLDVDIFEGKRKNLFKFAIRTISDMEALGFEGAHHHRRRLSTSILRGYDNVFGASISKKIGYIPSSAMPTAAANNVHVMKMCSALLSEGGQVAIYAEEAPSSCRLELDFVHEYFGASSNLKLNLFKSEGSSEKTAMKLVLSALADGCDRIFTRSIDVAILAGVADVPFVLELHKEISVDAWHKLSFIVRSPSFEGLVLITEALAKRFRGYHRELDRKIFVFPDAADEPGLSKARFELTPDPKAQLNVGYVGHLYPGKGAELAVELARNIPYVHFHMLGGLPEDVAHWKNETLGMPNITFYGHCAPSMVPSFIDEVDVAIAPFLRHVGVNNGKHNIASVFSPLKIFEYMALGKAIVCSDLPVIREVLEHNENALLCSPDSVSEWKAAFDLLLADGETRRRIASKAKSDFLNRYTWQKRANEILKIIVPKVSFSSGLRPVVYSEMSSSTGKRPLIKWFFGGGKQSGWAYGINAKRISSQIPDCDHIFDDEDSDLIPDVAIAFDVLIKETEEFKSCGAKRKVMRVGGPNPLKVLSGGDESILKQKLEDVDAIICLSPQLRDYVSRFHDEVYFVPNGIDLNVFNPQALMPKERNNELIVGMSASMKNEFQKDVKGYYYALEACEKIGAKLLVVGRGFNHVAHDRLIQDYYSKIDVLLHPVGPGKEASSNVIMEALALGVPVITTRYAGFHGIALKGRRDAIVVGRNVVELKKSLEVIKSKIEVVQLMRRAGYEFVQTYHDLTRVAKLYQNILIS